MTVSTVHPLYANMLKIWQKGRDCAQDESHIKSKRIVYLPPTANMVSDGQGTANSLGEKAYDSYLLRAVFPECYGDAIKIMVGLMHSKPPVIELPKVLEPMRERCNSAGDTLIALLRKINAEQLATGRVGLMGDIATSAGLERPLLLMYNETSIRNWDNGSGDPSENDVRFVVLDESRNVMQPDFTWEYKKEYRVIALAATSNNEENPGVILTSSGKYMTGLFEDGDDILLSKLAIPNIKGANLSELPFAFINAADLATAPDLPPLIGLANTCLTIYRGEADYRQNLFMQGQDTLVRIGGISDEGDPIRTGAGAAIDVPVDGDAKYIGVSADGLSEQRTALENDYQRAGQKGGSLLDATKGGQESGEALKTRVAAQTATLQDIALTGAAGLQSVLRTLAVWYGANPDEVVVTPNVQFADSDVNGQTLSQIVSAKMLGAPISGESIHEWMAERGVTSKTYEEEMALIDAEEPMQGLGNIIKDDEEPKKEPKKKDNK
jgi:hypothetical protein